MAEGLAAGNPGKKGDWVLRILRETGGLAGDAEDDAILAAQNLLARAEGIWAGPTGVGLPGRARSGCSPSVPSTRTRPSA